MNPSQTATLPTLQEVANAVQARGAAAAAELLQGMKVGEVGASTKEDAYPQAQPAPIFADFVPGALSPVQMLHTLGAIKRDPRCSAVSLAFVDGLARIILNTPINELIAARAELRRIEIMEAA